MLKKNKLLFNQINKYCTTKVKIPNLFLQLIQPLILIFQNHFNFNYKHVLGIKNPKTLKIIE